MMGWAVALLLASGCDCSGPVVRGGRCAGDDPPADCGETCGDDAPCAAGFYCGPGGTCTSDCDPSAAITGCPEGYACTAEGACELIPEPDTGPLPDGSGRDGSSNVCADVTISASRVTPNVVVIVDQSGSMTADFPGAPDRWRGLRRSLMDTPDGLIPSLQSTVRFGVALYSAEAPNNSSDPVPGMCPLVEWIPPALNNFDAIDAVYSNADPIDETPTGASVDAVLDLLTNTPDPNTDPTIFILATDGEPDTCEQPNPQNGQPQAIAAVTRAYQMGIRTFIISVGDDVGMAHLQDVANAGLGRSGADPDAEFWVAGDDAGLRSALTEIVAGQLSCVVQLDGAIQDLEQACTGRVTLNGIALECDDPNGWRVIDGGTIELQGMACERLQTTPDVTLEATFPCDVVLI